MKNNKNYFGIVRWCEEDIANAIAAELETVCKRLDYILEGRY